ncbi:IS4 family transposase [Amycolatopsis sulphurea]|uniref:IS4 family transposase n=1 Tax=Amycolatopsis sulphurea TaxID=76022 RepID=UPI0011459C98|nr:IS4 family transposase [Amycolatopsis sulphurea]
MIVEIISKPGASLSVHGVMPSGWSSPVGRLLSQAGLGLLSWVVPPALVDEALAVAGRDERRFRALPSRLGVYFVLALCLLRTKSGNATIRAMFSQESLPRLSVLGWWPPASTALTKLRDRIGVVPFQLLFGALARAAPTRNRPWSHAFGLEVCAWDGTEVEPADTAANREHFPPHHRTGVARGPSKIRVLVLLSCGSRRLLGAVTGPLSQGEPTLAYQLLPRLHDRMLLLADRCFLGYPLWTAARERGAHLLWRAKQNTPKLPVQHALPDESWLSTLHAPADARRWARNVRRNKQRGHRPPTPRPINGIVVRVVEALITVTVDGVTRTEKYRLVTSLLDPAHAPAGQLVALYARRWTAETGIKEIKTTLLAKRPLRGHTPIRAQQELWATLIVYQAIRLLISHAALTQNLDPSRISFTSARDAAEHAITTTPADTSRHLQWVAQDLCRQLITVHTHHRVYPRALKRTTTRYPHRSKTPQPTSTKASYQVHILPTAETTPPTTTKPTPHQPRTDLSSWHWTQSP